MGKEAKTFSRSDLERAQESLTHSGGTPYGQSCYLDADAWQACLGLLKAALDGDAFYIQEQD